MTPEEYKTSGVSCCVPTGSSLFFFLPRPRTQLDLLILNKTISSRALITTTTTTITITITMAAAATLLPTAIPFPPSHSAVYNPKVEDEEDDLSPFDPKIHLCFTPPARIYTMSDIHLPLDTGISPLAVSEPFPLFTPEAVKRMRREVLSPPVLRNCQYSSNLAQSQLRGYADKYAPFVYDAWKHPSTLAVVSQVAGIDLAVQFDFEIAHINLSFKTEEQKQRELEEFLSGMNEETKKTRTPTDDMPIVGWHRDSYPFVCVTMLSDCTEMIGGETALRMGDGEILKVRGPQMVIMFLFFSPPLFLVSLFLSLPLCSLFPPSPLYFPSASVLHLLMPTL